MNVATRAHRILAMMANYNKAMPTDQWPEKLGDGRLGEAIGCYQNPGPEGEVIGIFDEGMVWRDSGCWIELRFTDLAQVELPNGKESEGLLLRLQDGRQLRLPVNGQRGRFFDSMEMLRFVDRVLEDLRR